LLYQFFSFGRHTLTCLVIAVVVGRRRRSEREGRGSIIPHISLYISPYILFVERAPLIAFFFIAHVNLFLLFLFVVKLVVFYVCQWTVVCGGLWCVGDLVAREAGRGIFIDSYDVVCQVREGLQRHHQYDAQSSV
jgi:hypothetical protein